MDIHTIRRDTYAYSYYQDHIYDYHLREFLYHAISQVLASPSAHQLRVLDLGCGEQPLRPLVQQLGAHYVSADIVQNQSNTVDYLIDISSGNADKTIPGAYDLILLSEVLEHVSNPLSALLNIKKLLVPGGKAIITTPFVWPLHEEPHDYQRFTFFWFQKHLASHGFRIVLHKSFGSPLDVLTTLLLKTHIYAISEPKLISLISRLYAFMIRLLIACLVCLLSQHQTLKIQSSSGFYLVNCLVVAI